MIVEHAIRKDAQAILETCGFPGKNGRAFGALKGAGFSQPNRRLILDDSSMMCPMNAQSQPLR